MRTLAGGGIGALIAIVGLLAWGGATGGRGWAVVCLVCLGGVVIPAGFAVGCLGGAVASLLLAARRTFGPDPSATGRVGPCGDVTGGSVR